jgi:hypothetical protein
VAGDVVTVVEPWSAPSSLARQHKGFWKSGLGVQVAGTQHWCLGNELPYLYPGKGAGGPGVRGKQVRESLGALRVPLSTH